MNKTLKQAKEIAVNAIQKYGEKYLKTENKVEDKCQYFTGGGDRYCRITSQKNCRKCRFYSPTETAWRINMANLIEEMDETIEDQSRSIKEKNVKIHQLSADLSRERIVIRLHNFLTACLCSQEFFICALNKKGESILLAKGTKQGMREDNKYYTNLMNHIGDAVQYWTIMADGTMFVQLENSKQRKTGGMRKND